MTRKTHREVQDFVAFLNDWTSRHPERSKFGYALGRVVQRLRPVISKYSEAIEDVNVEHCATDDKGVMLTDARGGYCFDKPGQKARLAAIRTINAQEVEFEPYFAEIPDNLTDVEVAVCEGFVLRAEVDESSPNGTSRLVSVEE